MSTSNERPRLTDGEEAILQEIDEILHGFTVTRVGDDGKWHRVDPADLVPIDRGEPTP
jgi:hypothetical protein